MEKWKTGRAQDVQYRKSAAWCQERRALAEALEEHLAEGGCSCRGLRSPADVLHNLQQPGGGAFCRSLISGSARFLSHSDMQSWESGGRRDVGGVLNCKTIWNREMRSGLGRWFPHSSNKWRLWAGTRWRTWMLRLPTPGIHVVSSIFCSQSTSQQQLHLFIKENVSSFMSCYGET